MSCMGALTQGTCPVSATQLGPQTTGARPNQQQQTGGPGARGNVLGGPPLQSRLVAAHGMLCDISFSANRCRIYAYLKLGTYLSTYLHVGVCVRVWGWA